MSSRAFMILIAAIVVMIALFYTTPSEFEDFEQGPFLPGLKSAINDVENITITWADKELAATLRRGETQWTIAEHSGYAANVGKIRRNLIALADADIIELKTADRALYDRLGVQDLDQTDASGTRIDIHGLEKPISLIVGETGVRGNMAYVREVGAAQSYLVSADLDLGDQATDWLVKEIVNFSASDIHSVTISHPNGSSLSIEKPSRDASGFTVLNIPEGRELSYDTIADPIGGLLTALTLDDVESATGLDLSDTDPVVARFETFDGIVIEAEAYQLDDVTKVKFRVTADEALANSFSETDESVPDADVQAEGAGFSSIIAQAEELNTRLDSWVFTLPSFKSDELIKKMDDLLK